MEINNSNEIQKNYSINDSKNNDKEKYKVIQNEYNNFPSEKYEYITKGRKTVMDSSIINLGSPKKENPSRSKRLSLLGKTEKDINPNKLDAELFSFGKPSINSRKKLRNEKNEEDNNLKYKNLIKKISSQLRKRVKLPTCKIIKIYQPYRNLILRIAEGIKKTSKKYNSIDKNAKKQSGKSGASLIFKEKNNYSKKSYSNSKSKKIMEENINSLLSIDETKQNNIFINQFENFLQKNDIEILKETKLPEFNNENNKYLLQNLNFWVKCVRYICEKYKNELNFFYFLNLIELFYTWIDDKKYDSNIFNKIIIEQIQLVLKEDEINKFLLTYKLNKLEDLFSRYKSMNNFDYTEIKLSEDCKCPNCLNIKEKVVNYNKKNMYISYSEENNLDYGINKEPIKYSQSKTIYDNKFTGLSIGVNSTVKSDHKITDYGRYTMKKNYPKNISEITNIQQYKDRKITDFFYEKKVNKESEKQNKSMNSKSKSKSKQKGNKPKKKKLKSKEEIKKEILDLLNL